MDDNICEQCGTRNEPGVQFCVQCQSFLPWYDTKETDVQSAVAAAGRSAPEQGAGDPEPPPTAPFPAPVRDTAPVPGPVPVSDPPPAIPVTPVTPDTIGDGAAEPVRVAIEPAAVEVTPGGDEVAVEVVVYNLSSIVDAYRITAPDAPAWLRTSDPEVRLLPNSNDRTRFALSIGPGVLVPAGQVRLLVRTQSVARPEIVVDQYVDVTVPAIRTPLVLRIEPSIVRVKDAEAGRFSATVDNQNGNEARRVSLTGRDPEGAVRFFFSPPILSVPAGETASAAVRVEAPAPDPGQQLSRNLTVSASDGDESVDSAVTLVQTAAVEVPLTLRVEPSLLRVKDSAAGQVDITIDNRKGTRIRRIFLGGRDPERVVHFSFAPPSIDVLPGELGRARARVEAPQPAPGQEVSRNLTVLASAEGAADLEAVVTFVQATTAAPVDTPVVLRLDPSVVKTRDTAVGQLEVLIDNRNGRRVRRIFLTGRDPERLVRVSFAPPSLDVLPGDIGRSRVRLEAPLPEPGQEATRQVTVLAADGDQEVETSGTFVQFTSPAPVETPVALKLEPSLIRARDTPSGQFQVIVDNRQGIRPRRVTLAGTDPERAVGFSFWPPVVEVGRGQIARATGRLDAYPPEPGREVTRQFSVSASDGAKEVEADGTFIQFTSPPPPDEPLALRVDPSIVRVRNSGSGTATVFADNRGGSRHRRVQFAGTDPERVMRFTFDPPVIDLAPGQAGAVRLHVSAPRPDGGEQVSRPFSVQASDGSKDTEATGSFVQESSDWRPLWRIVLTLVGALLMIAGAFLAWNTNAQLDSPVNGNVTGLEWGLPAIDIASNDIAPDVTLIDLPDRIDPLVSAGAVIIALAALVLLGLVGSSGRLTRWAALLAAVALGAFVVAVSTQGGTGRPGTGVFAVFAGCAIAFAGGVLAKPRRQ